MGITPFKKDEIRSTKHEIRNNHEWKKFKTVRRNTFISKTFSAILKFEFRILARLRRGNFGFRISIFEFS